MKLEIGDHWAGFFERVVKDGQFGSADEVVAEGLKLLEERESKRRSLRDDLQSSVAQGGEVTDDELDAMLAVEATNLRSQGHAE